MGAGFRPIILENSLKGEARTRPDIFRVFLGPYVQYCPCEASEQKLGQKPKSEIKEIELSYCHQSSILEKNNVAHANI